MESILNDSNKTQPIERIKKADNTNEIMEPIDLIEWFHDESSGCSVQRCKPCFKLNKISNLHNPMLTPLPTQHIETLRLESLSLEKNQYWDKQKNLCIDYLCITSMAHEQVLLEESKKECKKKLCLKQVTEKHISSCNNLKQYQNTSKTHCYLY